MTRRIYTHHDYTEAVADIVSKLNARAPRLHFYCLRPAEMVGRNFGGLEFSGTGIPDFIAVVCDTTVNDERFRVVLPVPIEYTEHFSGDLIDYIASNAAHQLVGLLLQK